MTSLMLYLPRPNRVKNEIRARITSPDVDVEAIQGLLGLYGLELTGPPRAVASGRRTRNLVLSTTDGRKVLRRYRQQWPLTTIENEHAILKRLAEVGFPAPRLVATHEEKTWVASQGWHFALFDFIQGKNYVGTYLTNSKQRKLLTIAGQLLARFHKELAGFIPSGQHHLGFNTNDNERQRDADWYAANIPDLIEKTRAISRVEDRADAQWLVENADWVTAEIARLEESLSDIQLPRLIIHGDYGIHNMLFHDGTATVLDFELARVEWRVTEIAMVISRLGFHNSRYFLEAYQRIFPMKPEEWERLGQVWQLRNLKGAVQNWTTYFEMDIEKNLAAARGRINQASLSAGQVAGLADLRQWVEAKSVEKPARAIMVVRLFYPWVGGTERQAHKLAVKLKENGAGVEIVTGWWFRGTPQQETLDGIPVYRNFTFWEFMGVKGLRKFGGYLYILTLIWHLWRRRNDYDVIHVHGLNYHTFAAVLAGRWFNRKTIAKLANSGQASDVLKMREDRQLALARLMLPTALQCDQFVAINDTIVEELVAAGVPRERIVRLGNGVEIDGAEPRSDYTLGHPARLIYVGRLHQQKGLNSLLEAFQRLLDRYDGELCLDLIGDGPQRQELMDLAEGLGIQDQVIFHGQQDQVLDFLNNADVFVLPSFAEGISNALLEAMTVGLPVVVSNIPGNTDVIEHEKNGLLSDVGDPDSLAATVFQCLEQVELRQRLGRAARQTVEEAYSLDHVAESYIALYQGKYGT